MHLNFHSKAWEITKITKQKQIYQDQYRKKISKVYIVMVTVYGFAVTLSTAYRILKYPSQYMTVYWISKMQIGE